MLCGQDRRCIHTVVTGGMWGIEEVVLIRTQMIVSDLLLALHEVTATNPFWTREGDSLKLNWKLAALDWALSELKVFSWMRCGATLAAARHHLPVCECPKGLRHLELIQVGDLSHFCQCFTCLPRLLETDQQDRDQRDKNEIYRLLPEGILSAKHARHRKKTLHIQTHM